MKKKSRKEAVFFVDAVHPTHNTLAGYGWIRKGKSVRSKQRLFQVNTWKAVRIFC